jgi:hypothetical protein
MRKLLLSTAIKIIILSMSACSDSEQNGTTTPPTSSPSPQAEAPPTSLSTSSPQILEKDEPDATDLPDTVAGEVIISFDYKKQSGSASNQFAVWVEDTDGNYIQTLYATRWTAAGGYKNRPDSIALWVKKSALPSMTSSEVDAISGATPRAGEFSCVWDLTDAMGNIVLPGEYKFFVEGTLRWKNYVLYSGRISVGDTSTTVVADAEFVYEASDRYAALTSESSENAMIGAVTANYNKAAD